MSKLEKNLSYRKTGLIDNTFWKLYSADKGKTKELILGSVIWSGEAFGIEKNLALTII